MSAKHGVMYSLEDNVTIIVALLATAVLVSVVAERIGFPYVVALLVIATPLEISRVPIDFGPALLFIFLPALIFEAAWNVDATALRRHWRPVATMAIPGVLLTAFLVATGLSLAKQVPFVPALLLGAILAATDPIAVIAVFRRLHVPTDLATIVEGESLFNDGTAIVLYQVVLAAILAGHNALAPGRIALEAVEISLGGAAIGFAFAFVVAFVMRGIRDVPLQIVGTVVVAYGSYLIADRPHLSGIFAAVAAGISLRAFRRFPTTESALLDVERFWAVLAFVSNLFVFVLMGLRIEFARLFHEPLLVLLTLALVTLARILLGYVALPAAGIGRRYRGWQAVITLSGMRGALSVALVIGLPADVPFRAQLLDAVFGVVFLTLVGQGLSIGPLLARLRLGDVAA